MNSDTPKEGVVIDATPDPEESLPEHDTAPDTEEPKAPAEAAPRQPGRGPAGLALLLALIALGLTLAGGWFGYQQWQALSQDLADARSQGGSASSEARKLAERLDGLQGAQLAQATQLATLQDNLNQADAGVAEVQQQFTAQQQLMTSERALLDERETELRSLVSSLHERVGRSGTQWLIAEADYLINLADHRARLAGDPVTARAALALADQRLRSTGDPSWAGVREQLARDITRLDTLAQPDITGLWSRLGALIEQVPNLKLNDDPRRVARGEAPRLSMPTAEQERTWRTLLSDLWSGIKSAVRIRRNDEPVAAMLPPEQSYFLYENLRLKLQQGRLALLQGRADIYRQSLTEARDALGGNFQPDAVGQGLDAALAELQEATIQVELPDLSASLRAMQARRALIESQPAATPAAPEAPAAPANTEAPPA